MRARIATFVVALVGLSATGTAPKAEEAKPVDGTAAFTGVWIPQSSVFDGKEQLPDKASREMIRLSIENGEYKLYYLTDPAKLLGRRLSVADFSVDSKAGTFELVHKDGIKKGAKLHGIFELTKTTLKICYCPADKPRPTKFDAPAGSDAFCDVWERYKK